MKKIIIYAFLLLIINTIHSQVEYGGEPLSLKHPNKVNSIKEYELPYYNIVMEVTEPHRPVKTGELRKLDIDILKDIEQIDSKDYYIYKFNIKSLGTKSISIYFSQFILSENTKIFFYNKDIVLGSYNYRNVMLKNEKVFISPMIDGDYVTIEINVLKNEIDENIITISNVIHRPIDNAYIQNMLKKEKNNIHSSNQLDFSCLVDVNCYQGDEWCNQIRSVAVFSFVQHLGGVPHCENDDIGVEFSCSGALINNINNNFKQYFLTARHCTKCDIDHNTTTFRFNYQRSACGVGQGNINNYVASSVQGSNSIEHAYCDVSHSDISLLEILTPIPLQYNVYFSGWDANSQSLYTSVNSISHPRFFPKKISGGQIQSYAGPKWEVFWDYGASLGVSSGGPVFKAENKKIVAVISGSLNTEDCNSENQTWVGKFKSCWNTSNGLVAHLANGNISLTELDGIDPILACQENIELYGPFRDAREYNASKHQIHLQANNTVTISNISNSRFRSNSNFKITAGERITFLPDNGDGTEIINGAIFTAYIAPCTTIGYCGEESSAKNLKKEDIKTTNIGNDINLNLYPNPYSDNFSIEFNLEKQENVTIQISNTIGKIVYEESFKGQKGNQKHLINLEASDKILIAKICIGDVCYKAKMVKQ